MERTHQTKDITFKIDEPIVDTIPIKNEFGVGKEEEDDNLKNEDEDEPGLS